MRFLTLLLALLPALLRAGPAPQVEVMAHISQWLPYASADHYAALPENGTVRYLQTRSGHGGGWFVMPEPGVTLRLRPLPAGKFGVAEIRITSDFSEWQGLRHALDGIAGRQRAHRALLLGVFSMTELPAADAVHPEILITLFWC